MKTFYSLLLSSLTLLIFSTQSYAQYCNPTMATSWGNTSKVTTSGGVININKSTSNTGVINNFTTTDSVSTGLGQSFTISVTHGYSAGVWVDWNDDGDFTDAGEAVFVPTSYNGSTSITETHTVNVPASASTGSLRLRVLSGYYWQMAPCGYSSYTGDVEDYRVYVAPPETRDAELTGIYPATICPGSQDVNVLLTNRGVDSIASIIIKGNIGTTTFGPTTFTGLNVKNNKDTVLKIGTFNFSASSSYNMEFVSYTVNGATDQKTSNDTATYTGFKTSLNGVYTIGGTSPDFANFNAARAALYANGVCGKVTFNVRSGNYSEKVLFSGAIKGASAANTIRFRSDPSNSTLANLTFSSGNILEFTGGVNYIAFDSLSISATGSAYNIRFTGAADHISFNGNEIKANNTNYYLIYASSVPATAITIENNEFSKGYAAIYLYNNSSTPATMHDSVTIKNNSIEDYRYYGIYLRGYKHNQILHNDITSEMSTSTLYGIYAYYADFTTVIGNDIVVYNGSTGGGRALYMQYCDATNTNRSIVANNMITAPNQSSYTSYANYLYRNAYVEYVYNSFYGKRTYTSTTYPLLYVYGTTGNSFKNNSVFNDAAGYALRYTAAPSRSNNNLRGGAGVARHITGGTQGVNGLNLDPGYNSPTDLHITSNGLDGKGTTFTGITTDIDGDTRNSTTPDIGADEALFVNNDAGVAAFTSGPPCSGSSSVSVRVKNYGVAALTSVTVNWSVAAGTGSAVVQTPFSFTGNLAPGADTTVTIGNYTYGTAGAYHHTAYTTVPNATADQQTSNDTITYSAGTAMNGAYTIGGSGADYANFNAAKADLYTKGVCGPVTFNVRSGIYNEQVDFQGTITGSSSTNTVRFRPDPSNSSPATLTFNSDYTLRLGGGISYISFDSLDIKTTGPANVVELNTNNDHVSFTGNTFTGFNTTSSSLNYALIYDWSGLNTTNISILNNTFVNGSMPVYLYGQSTSLATSQDSFVIKNNTVIDAGYYGMYLRYVKNGICEGNDIKTKTTGYGGITYGIYGYYNHNVDILGNNVEVYASSYTYPIYLYRCYGTSTTNKALVANNMVSSQTNSTSSANYNYFYYCNYTDVVNNSFYGKRASISTSGGLVYLYYGTSVVFRNNSVFNDAAGYALDLLGSHTRSNNNLYGGNGVRNITGGTQGANGKNVDPLYVSTTDLHTESIDLYRTGIAIPGVTTDIDGDTRFTTPCIGADEYLLANIDASPVEVVVPPSCPGVAVYKAKIKNTGLNALTSFTVNWQVSTNGGTPSVKTPVSWSGTLARGAEVTVTLGNVSMANGSTYDVQLRTSNPNGTTDGKISNDTLNEQLRTAMNGTYTIGGLNPDYITPALALQDLEQYGVCGAVVFDIRPGNYVGQLKMEEIDGSSATNTITWRGTSVTNTTLSFVPSGAEYTLIDLNGTDYMKFSNLNIHCNTGAWTYAKNFRLYNNADHITIDSCLIQQNDNTNYQATGIAVSNSPTSITAGQRCHDLVITNNTIKGMDFGIGYQGQGTTVFGINLLIENNTFSKIDAQAIDVYYADSVTIKNNSLIDDVNYGIGFRYNNNYEISNNEIVAETSYGMYMYRNNYYSATSSNKALVYNNFISTASTVQAVYGRECNYLNFYHNSCRAKSSYAFYDYYGSQKKIQNNIFYSETNYSWYSLSTSSTYLNKLDNNLYHRGNNTSIAYYGGVRTLASWQSAYTAFNANSAQGDPKFVSSDDLHIANGKNADSLGASGLGINMDIDGATRSTTHPDAGADEFDYQPIDGHLVLLTRPSGQCLTATDTVEFAVVNVGGDTIDMAANGLNIAWEVTGPNTANGTDAVNTGKAAPGDTVYVKAVGTFVNFSTPGKYTVSAYITSLWDKYNENDTLEVEIERQATEVLKAIKDTTLYYKDSISVSAQSIYRGADVKLTEVCQYNYSVGAPVGGRATYMNSEDEYAEISTGKGSFDMAGYRFERWIGASMNRGYTFTAGQKTSPNGTLILGIGSSAGDPVSPANFYYRTGGGSNGTSSGSACGYILKDPAGNIIDAVATNNYNFPISSGVTSTDWSGSTPYSGSTHGIRRVGPDDNTGNGWVVSSNTVRQDPNVLNPGLNLSNLDPTALKWTYNGSVVDTSNSTMAGPWTSKGTKDYIVSLVSVCSGDTLRDTASIVAFEKNLVMAGNTPEYSTYPLSQTSGIDFSGTLNNYGDAMTSVRANVTLAGAAAGDTLVSSSMARNASGNFEIPNSATVTTTGMKAIKYFYTATTGDDFISDDSSSSMVSVSDTIMARDNGVFTVNATANGTKGLGQRFTVFNQDSVTGAQAYVKTAFAGDKFKFVLYELNGNTVGSKLNESGDVTLQSTSDTGWKQLRFNCLSVLSPGDYLLGVELTSTVFSSGLGVNHVNATANSGFIYNGTTWSTTLVNGENFNSGLRLEFGSYDYPTFAALAPACISGDTFALSGGAPLGGSYVGTGITANVLDPTALTVGTNTIQYVVDNVYGCPDTIESTIEIKGDPVVSSTFTQLTSCVSPNAAISVSATGAFGTLSYSINNGSSFQSTGTFNNIGSGSYTVVVEDSVCSVTDTTYVATPPGAPNKPTATGGNTYCKGDALSSLNVSSNTSGTAGTFKWFKDGSLTISHGNGSSIAPTDTIMTQVYYVIEDRLGCVSVADTTVVTINALPNVNVSSLSARCTNADSIVLANGTPTGGSYSGNGVSSGVFKPGVAGAGTHLLTYSYTDGNSCTDNDTVSIVVHQAPVATYSVVDSACTNTPTYALSGGAPSGGTYSGFGVSGGNFNPNTAGLGTHAISYKVSNTNCSDSASITIRVNLAPNASFSSISDRCVDASPLVLSGGSPTGGVYSGNGVLSGSFNPTTAGVGTHTLKYVYTDSKLCMDSATTTAHVDSLPAVSFASLSALCANSSQITLSQGSASPTGGTGTYFGTGISGTTFSPTTSGAGSFNLGYAYEDNNGCKDTAYTTQVVDTVPIVAWTATLNDVCIDAPTFALSGATPVGGVYNGPSVQSGMFTADTAGAGSHTLGYVFTDGNNCKDSVTNMIWVDTLPTVALSLPRSWCLNAPPIPLNTGMPSGGSYTVNNITDTVFKSLNSGVDTVIYSYTDTNNCTNTASANVIVDTIPVVTFASIPDACVGDNVIQLKQGAPAGGTYSGNQTSSKGFYAPIAVQTDTLSYHFVDQNGCADSTTQTVTVNALPTVNFSALSSVCQNAGVVSLSGGTPIGGTYTGNGVNGGVFNPLIVSVGVDTIEYTFVDGNNCVNSAKQSIEVYEAPVAKLAQINDVCDDGDTIKLTMGTPAGGTYSGPGVNGGIIVPEVSLVGTNTVTYLVTNTNCSDTATTSYMVAPTPVFNVTGTLEGCQNDTLTLSTNATTGFVHKWSNGGGSQSTDVTVSGMVWVKVIDPTTALRCSSFDTVDVKLEGECVGIDAALLGNEIRYFPNPNNGSFNYEISGLSGVSASIRVFAASGQEVYTVDLEEMSMIESGEIFIENAEQGVYYIQFNSSKGSAVHRIVINK